MAFWGKLRLCGSLNRTEWFPEKLSFTLCKVHHHERERKDRNTDTQKLFVQVNSFGGGGI